MLRWNLFNGLGDRAKLAQASLEVRKLQTALEEVERRIEMQVEQGYYDVESAFDQLAVAGLASKSARENFRMVSVKYERGVASQVVHLDARTAHTSAEISEIVTRYEALIRLAELEWATAGFNLNTYTPKSESR